MLTSRPISWAGWRSIDLITCPVVDPDDPYRLMKGLTPAGEKCGRMIPTAITVQITPQNMSATAIRRRPCRINTHRPIPATAIPTSSLVSALRVANTPTRIGRSASTAQMHHSSSGAASVTGWKSNRTAHCSGVYIRYATPQAADSRQSPSQRRAIP